METQLSRGREAPDWYLSRPELWPGQEFYLTAFDRLTTCRPLGSGGIGRIPWTAIVKYSEVHGMDFYELQTFQYLMERMDTVYIKWVQEKADKGETDG